MTQKISFFIPIFDKTKEWKMFNQNISGSAKNEASEKRSSAVSKKRASAVSSASSSKKVEENGGRSEAVKTAEKKERVPTGKEERPPTGVGENKEATEAGAETTEDMRKTQAATPVILEQVILLSSYVTCL